MKGLFFSVSCFILFCIIQQVSFFREDAAEDVLHHIAAGFHEGLEQLDLKMEEYLHIAKDFQPDSVSMENLRNIHLETRLSFKKIEFLLEYFDPEGIRWHLNGAPLPKLEPNVPQIRIFEPSGLQTMEELVFSENPYREKEEIIRLISMLNKKYKEVHTHQINIQLEHRYIFEAARLELIRIFTLGVSGFDTPGSGNAIPEAQQAFEGFRNAISFYFPLLEKEARDLRFELDRLMAETNGFLQEHPDFETFDRLEFLKKYIQPLNCLLLEAHKQLGIETITEVTSLPQPSNYDICNIFSDDFLNPFYYSDITPKNLTAKRIELGRLLFFDPILSKNNQRSCASCHQPDKAFTDGLDKSMAFDASGKILRNAPTLINSVYAERYFYDLREPDLERQIKHVILDEKEFNTDFFEIIGKLEQSSEYQRLFEEAYNDYPDFRLSKWSVSNALASYLTSLRAFNSPIDRYIRGELSELSPAAIRGFNLFMGKAACGTCHFAPVFNGTVPPLYMESESEVLGVPMTDDPDHPVIDPDPGRIGSYKPQDEAPFFRFSFKTPTVRNIALTAPYMHNGVFATLKEVIEFYNKGGGIGLGIDVPHQTLPDAPLELTETDINDLVVFLETLTDTTGLTTIPEKLPAFEGNPDWNKRKPGGIY